MRRLLVLAVALCALLTSVALAATKHGVKPSSPKKGATVATGSRPVFSGTAKGKGKVYVYVSKSKKTDKFGLIGDDQMIQKARKKGSSFSVKAKFFDYPKFWLNSPGTYYWQAHRVHCDRVGEKDCRQEGPIVSFKVG